MKGKKKKILFSFSFSSFCFTQKLIKRFSCRQMSFDQVDVFDSGYDDLVENLNNGRSLALFFHGLINKVSKYGKFSLFKKVPIEILKKIILIKIHL